MLRNLAIGLLALIASQASASDKADPPVAGAPADTAPPKLTTLDFVRRPDSDEVKISPSGKYLAMRIPDGDLTKLCIVDVATMRPTTAYNMADDEFVNDFYWVNDQQIVWETAKKLGPLSRPVLTGHLMVGRADKTEVDELHSPEFFVDRIRGTPDTILVQLNNTVYREKLGAFGEHKVAEVPYRFSGFLADHSGKVRMAGGMDKQDIVTSLWDEGKGEWREIRRARSTEGTISPLGFAADDRNVYIASDVEASTAGIYQMDTATSQSKLIFRDDKVDFHDVLLAPGTDEPVGVLYYPDYPAYRFFDNDSLTARTYAGLKTAFPNCVIHITSSSDDGKLAIVAVESDVKPPEYYLLSLDTRGLTPLFRSRPWIKQELMSEMSPFVIKARDGLELHGYLTLPKGAGEKKLPMVVMPHGGPMGVRDIWGFDPEVQFLAYHGYAVLQINFRGSGGYGHEFERMGNRHWGTSMQDDITDATHWVIQQGIADPARICIYGASYGGYAAMMGVIREPDLYRCAIGYAGAYDLTVQKTDSDTAETREGRVLLSDSLGDDKDDLKARSPLYNVDKIRVPLLLAHGKDDPRVPYENLTKFTEALDKAGKKYETLVKRYEGHGFYSIDNNVELYDRILAFLGKNIGPGASAVAVPPAPPSPPAATTAAQPAGTH